MKKTIAMLLACMMLVGMLAACSKAAEPATDGAPTAETASANSDRAVNVYVESTIAGLHPYTMVGDYATCYVLNNVYETLYRADQDNNVQPCLAKSYTVSEDGLVYTFELEQGVKFHDGTEMKASDVAFSFNTAIATPAMSGTCSVMDHATATGDYTMELTLKSPFAAVFMLIPNVYIVSEKFYTANENIVDTACGTGPYKLREGAVDLSVEVGLDRFDEYRLGPAAIPAANLKIITDASTARIQMEGGELDFMMVYNTANYQPLLDTGLVEGALATAPHTAYIAVNNEKEPLNNKAFRQALNYATDNESIVVIAYEGLAEPARALTGANSFGVDFTDCTDFTFNIDKAKEKLAEAGFPDGINLSDYGVELVYIAGSYHEKIANCLKESWAQAGIQVELRAGENLDCANGEHTLYTNGTSYKQDMSHMVGKYGSKNIGSENYAFYRNDRVDELFELAAVSTDQEARKAMYKEITEHIVDDAPYIPIQHKQIPYVWTTDLDAKVYPSNEKPWYIYDWSWK